MEQRKWSGQMSMFSKALIVLFSSHRTSLTLTELGISMHKLDAECKNMRKNGPLGKVKILH